jgi:hypothetical protein
MSLTPKPDKASTYTPPLTGVDLDWGFAGFSGTCPICTRSTNNELICRMAGSDRWLCSDCLPHVVRGRISKKTIPHTDDRLYNRRLRDAIEGGAA